MNLVRAIKNLARRRVLAWSVIALVATVIVGPIVGLWVARSRVTDPSMSLPDHADAVVVFFGGEDRASAATELMDAGIADTLVINHGSKNGQLREPYSPLCVDQSLAYEVVCIVAEPSSTAGEARAFSELADTRQWSTLIAYTSNFHLERARFLLGRCFDGSVYGQSVDSNNPTAVGRETRKLLASWIIQRSC